MLQVQSCTFELAENSTIDYVDGTFKHQKICRITTGCLGNKKVPACLFFKDDRKIFTCWNPNPFITLLNNACIRIRSFRKK